MTCLGDFGRVPPGASAESAASSSGTSWILIVIQSNRGRWWSGRLLTECVWHIARSVAGGMGGRVEDSAGLGRRGRPMLPFLVFGGPLTPASLFVALGVSSLWCSLG